MNKTFDIKRFMQYAKSEIMQSWKINIVFFIGLSGVLILFTIYQIKSYYDLFVYTNGKPLMDEAAIFAIPYLVIAGLALVSFTFISYTAFKNTRKTIFWLLIPASSFEKFIYEIKRVIIGGILIFILCWVFYIISVMFLKKYYCTDFNIFNFILLFTISWFVEYIIVPYFLIITLILSVLSWFKNNNVLKAIGMLSLIIIGYIVFTFFTAYFLGFINKNSSHINETQDFLFSFNKYFNYIYYIPIILTFIALLGVNYLKIKEKEV